MSGLSYFVGPARHHLHAENLQADSKAHFCMSIQLSWEHFLGQLGQTVGCFSKMSTGNQISPMEDAV